MIDAKNGLENHCFQMKNTLNNGKLKEKFSDEDKKTVKDTSQRDFNSLRATKTLVLKNMKPSRRNSRLSSIQS